MRLTKQHYRGALSSTTLQLIQANSKTFLCKQNCTGNLLWINLKDSPSLYEVHCPWTLIQTTVCKQYLMTSIWRSTCLTRMLDTTALLTAEFAYRQARLFVRQHWVYSKEWKRGLERKVAWLLSLWSKPTSYGNTTSFCEVEVDFVKHLSMTHNIIISVWYIYAFATWAHGIRYFLLCTTI